MSRLKSYLNNSTYTQITEARGFINREHNFMTAVMKYQTCYLCAVINLYVIEFNGILCKN